MVEQRKNPIEANQLSREATTWFTLMRGEDADQHRAEFERWLARGALHRAAYNRVASIYSAGKRVNWDNLPPAQPVRGAAKRVWMIAMGIVAMIGFLVWRMTGVPIIPGEDGNHDASSEIARGAGMQYATRLGEIRTVRLPDGSMLTIDTDTLVTVDFGSSERQLRLEHGRARFKVAHEARPFIVDAGNTEVIARGTVFDVSFEDSRKVWIHLLQGRVDVKRGSAAATGEPVTLQPGDVIRYEGDVSPKLERRTLEAKADWPNGMVEFQRTPLAEVVREMNRYGAAKVVLADPVLGSIEVSGSFRIDQPDKLADLLAQALGLDVKRAAGEILLSRREK